MAIARTREADSKGSQEEVAVYKVSAKSKVSFLSGAIASAIQNGQVTELQVVGAGALNQAVKSVAVARGMTAPNGYSLTVVPSFFDVEIAGERKTAIKLLVQSK